MRNRADIVSVHLPPSLPSTANKSLQIQQNYTARAASSLQGSFSVQDFVATKYFMFYNFPYEKKR